MGTLASGLRALAGDGVLATRVYVDANIPARLVDIMRHEFKWDVLFVLEDPALRRAPDREHFSRALDLGRTLITLDRDFLDDTFPSELSPGVIVCSAPDERWLLRLLRHAHSHLLHEAGTEMPLKGRKVELTMESLA
jgi:predicted nuclease of predicted toxin-antitoxin system